MKTNWQTKRLGEISEIVTGNTPKTSHKEYFGTDILWAGPSDLDQGVFVINTNKKLSKKGIEEGGARLIPKDSVLLSCIGNIGKIGIAIEEMATNQQINTFVPKKEILDSKYLYYSLITRVEDFKNASSQTTLPIINKTKCSNIEIPLPPLKTQKEIVARLDEKFAKLREAKRLQEEALADTEKILSQTLREIFEEGKEKRWQEKEMGNVLDKIIGGGTPSKANSNYWNGDIPWASVKDLKEDQQLIEKTKDFITKEGLGNSSANLIPKGSLIISTRMGLGRVAKNTIDLAINQDLKALIPKKIIDIDFLTFVLMNKSQEIISGGKGATVSGVTLDFFKKIKILLPSLSEQQKIVTKLDELSEKVRTLRKLQTSQLADLKRLEKSYLREAFNGELI